MPEDEIERLRAADPAARASSPSARDPRARALFERITMTPTEARSDRPTAVDRPTWRRPSFLAPAAAALLVVLVGGTAALTSGDSAPRQEATATTTVDDPGEAVTPGGTSTGSCVEVYDLEALKRREFAFDGTITTVEGDAVVFTVHEWFRGGSQAEVRMNGAQAMSGLTSAGAGVGFDPGTRLLVAGDGGFVWSCGFTQPFDAEIAEAWATALRG